MARLARYLAAILPPRIWNQGKAYLLGAFVPLHILPPPDLESRQSSQRRAVKEKWILPPPDLESRQSGINPNR